MSAASEDLISFLISQPPSWQAPQASVPKDKSPTLSSIAQSLQSTQFDKLTSQLIPPLMYQDAGLPSVQQVKQTIENEKNEDRLVVYLKQLIILTLNGVNTDSCLMSVIRFVMPRKNKALKKLLHLYWEICPKYSISGSKKTLKHEMVLVVNALQHDLTSPNEYIRANTLRLIAKLHEQELLEPLTPHLRQCLEHRHPLVKKQAIITTYKVHLLYPHLIPDAPDLLFQMLSTDNADAVIYRTILNALFQIQPQLLHQYLNNPVHLSKLLSSDESTLLLLINLLNGSQFAIKSIFALLNSQYPCVQFEAAITLCTLSKAIPILKQCAETFLHVIRSTSDINVKLIVLDQLYTLLNTHPINGLGHFAVDVLTVLDSPDLHVRQKALALSLLLLNPKSIDNVVVIITKYLTATTDIPFQHALLSHLSKIIQRFNTNNHTQILHICTDLLFQHQLPMSPIHPMPSTYVTTSIHVDLLYLLQLIIFHSPATSATLLDILITNFNQINSGKVMRHILWMLNEYSKTADQINRVFALLLRTNKQSNAGVLAINTSQSALDAIISRGDYFTASVLASTLLKLVYKSNLNKIQAILTLTNILKDAIGIDEDSRDYIYTAITLLATPEPSMLTLFNADMRRNYYDNMVLLEQEEMGQGTRMNITEPLLFFDAQGAIAVSHPQKPLQSKLAKIVQLTGMSDEIYAECIIEVHQFDILLDIILVNQSPKTLQNISIEFSTLGDLKMVEKPSPFNMGAYGTKTGYKQVKTTIKVSSTETGVIFGTLFYNGDTSINMVENTNIGRNTCGYFGLH